MLWLAAGDRLWLTRRPDRGVWAGLWTLPLFDSIDHLRAAAAAWPGHGEALPPIDHALTHFDWHLEPWRHRLPARLPAATRRSVEATWPHGRWVTLDEALAMGLPAPIRKLLQRY
jgi:A/G-specific adenine glycosylase